MKQHNERFEKHLDDKIHGAFSKKVNDRTGVVLSYNMTTNTATVALSGQDSDNIDDIIKDVQCPTYNGLQLAAPEAGRGCWVVFKGGRESQPRISHFYNHDYKRYDYDKISSSKSELPSYLTM